MGDDPRRRAARARPPTTLKLVALHLGNGASAAAIRDGVSVDTSMGLTPLEGLVMGTRSGDVDPALIGYLVRARGRQRGRGRGLAQRALGAARAGRRQRRLRDLLARERDDARARLAVDVFCHRARKYLGAYLAVLDGADAVVFTGGIGTHQPEIRRRIAGGFDWCGLRSTATATRRRAARA